jgi:hypothetical protein
MGQMPSPPPGYDCEIRGFNNIPPKAGDKMPGNPTTAAGPNSTTLADYVADHSNTTPIPFGGPNVPKGM